MHLAKWVSDVINLARSDSIYYKNGQVIMLTNQFLLILSGSHNLSFYKEINNS